MSAVCNPEARIEALDRLGTATRERLDKATKALYLEDTAGIETRVFVEACRRLEKSATWFPKLRELIDECSVVARWFSDREAVKRLPPADECDPERAKEWIERIKVASRGHRMPDPEVPTCQSWTDLPPLGRRGGGVKL